MNDRIGQLLRDADAAHRPAGGTNDLAGRVRERRDRRRRRRASAVATLSILVMIGAAAWLTLRPATPVGTTKRSPMPETDSRSVELLAVEAQLHEQTAARMLAAAQTKTSRSSPSAWSARPPADVVQTQRDRAALILVYDADRSVREKRPADAIAAYRRAVELFPQSHWAQVARRRLAEMQT
jgi:hypothetical protein